MVSLSTRSRSLGVTARSGCSTCPQCPAWALAEEVAAYPCTDSPWFDRQAGRSLDGMDHHDEVRDFLRTRRARVTPAEVGLVGGGRRRVPGLRREEVALLAGVS